MEDKYDKLVPIIEKLIKLHFKDKMEMVFGFGMLESY
jgi:hypothetical protein